MSGWLEQAMKKRKAAEAAKAAAAAAAPAFAAHVPAPAKVSLPPGYVQAIAEAKTSSNAAKAKLPKSAGSPAPASPWRSESPAATRPPVNSAAQRYEAANSLDTTTVLAALAAAIPAAAPPAAAAPSAAIPAAASPAAAAPSAASPATVQTVADAPFKKKLAPDAMPSVDNPKQQPSPAALAEPTPAAEPAPSAIFVSRPGESPMEAYRRKVREANQRAEVVEPKAATEGKRDGTPPGARSSSRNSSPLGMRPNTAVGGPAGEDDDAFSEGEGEEQKEGEPNIFFQNARFSGRAPSPERLPAYQRLPSTIYFFVRVSDQDGQVSLVKPLSERIKEKMHKATALPGHESAGPTSYLEFNEKTVIGLDLNKNRLGAVKLDHSLQLVIEVPSCEAFPKQNPRVEPTSIKFQPYQSTSRHGDWLPRINVPIRCGPERVKQLKLASSSLPPTGKMLLPVHSNGECSDTDDVHVQSQASPTSSEHTQGGILGNPYASATPAEGIMSSRAALASERRLIASNKRLSSSRLMMNEHGDLKLPNYNYGNTTARSTVSARSTTSSSPSQMLGGSTSARSPGSPPQDRSPQRDVFWPRELATNEMYAERLRKGTDKRKEERDIKERAKREAEETIKAEQKSQAYAVSHRTIKFSDAIRCDMGANMCSSSGEDSFSMGEAPAAPSAETALQMKHGASFKAKIRQRSLSTELEALKNKNKPSESAGGFGTVGATVLGSVLFKGLASVSEPAPNFDA